MSRAALKIAGAEPTHKRRAEIIDAAARVFAAKGFHGASTQDIADVLGIRQASLYYYFPRKEDALRMVCEHGAENFLERAQAIVSGTGGSRDKLIALIRAHIAPLADRADYVRVFLRERQHLPASERQRISKLAADLEACFEMVIRDGIAHGVFSPAHDPRLATLAILGMVNGAPFWPDRKDRRLEDVSNSIARIALGGLTGVQWHGI